MTVHYIIVSSNRIIPIIRLNKTSGNWDLCNLHNTWWVLSFCIPKFRLSNEEFFFVSNTRIATQPMNEWPMDTNFARGFMTLVRFFRMLETQTPIWTLMWYYCKVSRKVEVLCFDILKKTYLQCFPFSAHLYLHPPFSVSFPKGLHLTVPFRVLINILSC